MRTSVLKIVAAFVAGLVIALASALMYVRAQDSQMRPPEVLARDIPPEAPPEEMPAPPAVTPEASRPTNSATTEASRPAQPNEPVNPAPAQIRQTKPTLRPKIVPRPAPRIEAREPVQVVQNTGASTAVAANLPSQASYPPISSQPASAQLTSEQSAPPMQRPEPNVVDLSAGTALTIRLGETLSTEHNYTGDTFRGTLDAPIIRNGFVIADKGSKVLGRIVDSTPPGRVRGLANLSLTLTEINTTDGQRIRVETNAVEKRGVSSNGTDAAKIAGGAALGAIIGALGGGGKGAAIGAGAGGAAGTGVVLATRGKPAVLPTESVLTFQLSSPVTITEKLN